MHNYVFRDVVFRDANAAWPSWYSRRSGVRGKMWILFSFPALLFLGWKDLNDDEYYQNISPISTQTIPRINLQILYSNLQNYETRN